MTVQLALMVVALVCFICGAAQIPWRINFVSLGLAFWVLSLILR